MNCRRCESQLETDELRCPVCSLVAPPSAAHQGAATMKVLRCETCGAAMARWSAETQAVRCVFCDAQAKLQELVDPMEQTEAWVPFRLDAPDARTAVKRWLGQRGFFAPGDLASSSIIENLTPVYYPAWAFTVRADVWWAADDGGPPSAGRLTSQFENIVVPASTGLTADEARELARHTDVSQVEPRAPEQNGLVTEVFDVPRSRARDIVAQRVEALTRAVVIKDHLPGGTYKKLALSVVLTRLSTRRLGLPAWILAYHYRGRSYRLVVHGQDGARAMGDAPLSLARIFLAWLAFVALLIMTAFGVGTWIAGRSA